MKAIPITDLRVVSLPQFWCPRRQHIWAEVITKGEWREYKCIRCPKTHTVWRD